MTVTTKETKTVKNIFNNFETAKNMYSKIKALNIFPIFLNRSYPVHTSIVLAILQASSNETIAKITGLDPVESEIQSLNIFIKPYFNKNSFTVQGQKGDFKELQRYLEKHGHKTDLSYLESLENSFETDYQRINNLIS